MWMCVRASHAALEHAKGLIDQVDVSGLWGENNTFQVAEACVLLPYAAACLSLTTIDAEGCGMDTSMQYSDENGVEITGLRSDQALEKIVRSRGGWMEARIFFD